MNRRPEPTTADTTCVTVRPWTDALVDERGHDPRGAYVERYWLGVIGPTATWISRRFADEFDRSPDGFTIDLTHTATTMGLSFSRGTHSPFGKALQRCVMFGLALPSEGGYSFRRRFPTVARRHLERLPADFRDQHDDWARLSMRADRRIIERCLIDAGVSPAAAARAGEVATLVA